MFHGVGDPINKAIISNRVPKMASGEPWVKGQQEVPVYLQLPDRHFTAMCV